MDLKVGDRVLVKHHPDKSIEEDEVREQYGEYTRWRGSYPSWRKTKDTEILGKLPPKEPKISIRSPLNHMTENLDCPLSKKPCSRGCAWHSPAKKTCIILQLADDINELVDDD